MVRLGAFLHRDPDMWVDYFNSTMVRLGGFRDFVNSLHIKFQFHYGSIGSSNYIPYFVTQRQISIPLWFDWECTLK